MFEMQFNVYHFTNDNQSTQRLILYAIVVCITFYLRAAD